MAQRVLVAENGCWLWAGHRDTDGYGQTSGGRAHRIAYLTLVGEIPDGMILDHLCRRRYCVNPEHLQPVTAQENALRSPVVTPRTACRSGRHPWPEHMYVRPSGERECSACRAERAAEYHARRRKSA